MTIPKIYVDVQDSEAVRKVMDSLEPQSISVCNWPEVLSYVPDVKFRMFHTGENLVIRYDVCEKTTQALAGEDDGKVWEDSCVELFMSTDNGEHYYNFEANCIGKMHIGYRKAGEKAVHANAAQFAMVKRYPSIGTAPFTEISGGNSWCLTLVIPASALFGDNLDSWSGLEATINLYKCGDRLSDSHYVSWAPINIPEPSFHQPAFFRKVLFEK